MPLSDMVASVIHGLGLGDEEAVVQRMSEFGFSDEDQVLLRELGPSLDAIWPKFVDRLQTRPTRFMEAYRRTESGATWAHPMEFHSGYRAALTKGELWSDFIHARLRVGFSRRRTDQERWWYPSVCLACFMDLLFELEEYLGAGDARLATLQRALLKLMFLDIGLVNDAHAYLDKKAIQTLREFGDRVFSAIPDGVAVLRADYGIVSVNRAFAQRFGLEEGSSYGHSLFSLVSAEGLEDKLREVRESDQIMRDLPFDMRVVPASSLPVRVRVTIAPVPFVEDDGNDARLLLLIKDVSEQARLHQALEDTKAALLRAQEVARIGSWWLDPRDGTLVWSPEVFRILGLKPETPVHFDIFRACIHREDREVMDAALEAALKGTPYRLEHRIEVSGDTRWVEERATIEFDENAKPSKVLGTIQDITDRKSAEMRIENLAFYDTLTSLPNRALFMDRLRQGLAAAERRSRPLCLLFLDLDRFKEINDTLGHDAGDRVLAEVANRLRRSLREEEILARLSGDEFVIVAYGAAETASQVANRIRHALAPPFVILGQSHVVSASIGISVFPEDGRTLEDLLKHADIAMYRAKGNGDGYRFYRAEMGEDLSRKLAVAKRLEAALKDGVLKLHYQPQVNLVNGRLIGAEALVRWEDEEWGAVPPADFIPVAEERGLIGVLGEWALQETCRQIRSWREKDRPMPGKIAVNVAARQFEDDGFVERVISIARENQVPTHLLELELTESGMMMDPERAVDVTRALASAGFTLSIDDFGTGYSSLAYLKRFPVSKLKIDISFVRDMLTDRNDHAIVDTIIAMGKSMGLETLAEGVENADQVDSLLALGCQMAQGYHFDRPLAPLDFERGWLPRLVCRNVAETD
ncbi:MAG: EAL domain-containing protein [Rhodospirillum sp.]|nr:EAL domain-containing protein [Rhodospirillum sp.]MCF8487715.1 EAL domain-containing protein [Rhodospirillum sp.]MCF8502653.1 EAL domain-containing protein [Rhodospirillum sp.]